MQIHADADVYQRVDEGGRVAGIGKELVVQRYVAAQPQPVDDRIDDEKEEDEDVGDGECDRPGVVGAQHTAVPRLVTQPGRPDRPADRNNPLCHAHWCLVSLSNDELGENLVHALERLIDSLCRGHAVLDDIGDGALLKLFGGDLTPSGCEPLERRQSSGSEYIRARRGPGTAPHC